MLTSQNVLLRGLEYSDLDRLHSWMNNFEILKGLLRIDPSIKHFTEKWYERVNTDPTKKIFAITDKISNQFIGCVGVNNIDHIDRKAEFYIYIGEMSYQGKGYAKEAMTLFLEYMFNYQNLHKIYLHVRYDHPQALHLYEKVGFKTEGILRAERYIEGRYIDIIRMGLLKGEYCP